MLNNSYLNFIAEISSNHNQSLSRCYKLIDKAKDVGCKSVKFQHFKIEELFHSRVLKRKNHTKIEKNGNYLMPLFPKFLNIVNLKICYLDALHFLLNLLSI